MVGSTRSAAHAATDFDSDINAGNEQESAEDLQLLQLGARTLGDLIAPSGVEIKRDHLRLDGQYARVLAVTAYPRLVSPGWLSLLVETDLPIELSLHVRPLASAEMVRALGVQIARLQSSRLAALRGERVADPEREIALEDAERLRERLQRGEERLFAVSLYLLLRASTLRELDELTRRVEEQLDALLAHSRRALWEQERGFFSCLPEARDGCWCRATWTPARWRRPAVRRAVAGDGRRHARRRCAREPDTGAAGSVRPVARQRQPGGRGARRCWQELLLQAAGAAAAGQWHDCIAVDPENEYRPLAEAVGGQVVRLAASSAHHLNPFDLPPPVEPTAAEDSANRDC